MMCEYTAICSCPSNSDNQAHGEFRRPDQIEVIMAMGDSLTAAMVARDSPDPYWLDGDTIQRPLDGTSFKFILSFVFTTCHILEVMLSSSRST